MYNAIIVDDETFEARAIAEIIDWAAYGFNLVKLFNKPTDALAFLETHKIDIIFSDIKMPFMDGLELCEKVGSLYPDIVFVIITAYSDFSYAQRAIRSGVMDYIVKPITYAQLDSVCKSIRKTLDERGSDDSEDIDISFLAHQQLITNYFSGIIDSDRLNTQLAESTPDFVPSEAAVAVTKIKINDFFEYLKYTWKHGINRFYSFLMSRLNTYDMVSFPLDCSFDTLTVLTFFKGRPAELFSAQIKELFSGLTTLCSEVLSVSLTINTSHIYENISALKKSENIFIKSFRNAQSDMDKKIKIAKSYVENNYMNDISIYNISDLVELSPYYFCEHFKKNEGLSFTAYVTQIRIEHAKTLLTETNLNVTDICRQIGFNTKNYFFKVFKDYTGLTPKEFRTEHKK